MQNKLHPRIVAIVQARMSSARLPGKVLQDLGGQPMLVRVVERARRAKSLSGVVVATTTDPSDDAIARLCAERGYPCYRGSLQDVLDRYYQAARVFWADVIVRLTADCPVIDPAVIDQTVGAFSGQTGGAPQAEAAGAGKTASPPYDFAANRLPPPWKRTFPIGLDVEVCTFAALERAWKEADQPHQREHVMPYLYEDLPVVDSRRPVQPAWAAGENPRFRVLLVNHAPDYGSLRWTVDTPTDLELLRQVYARFDNRDDFSWLEVLELFEREPELAQINAGVQHKTARDVDKRSGY